MGYNRNEYIMEVIDNSKKIYDLSLELKKSKEVRDINELLMLIRSLSKDNTKKIEDLLNLKRV